MTSGSSRQVPAAPTLRLAEDDFTFRSRVDLANPFTRTTLNSAFFPALIAFYEREYRTGVRPHLSVALLNGRIGFVGVSGEVFCAHSLHLKRRARLDHLFFLGYCNDYQQYFPTIEAVAEGGYGTEPFTAPSEVGAGRAHHGPALIHLYQMRAFAGSGWKMNAGSCAAGSWTVRWTCTCVLWPSATFMAACKR